MNEDVTLRLLRSLLDGCGAEWIEESGWIRFRSRREGMLWETDCCMRDGAVLVYGRFPFHCRDTNKALKICDEINRTLTRGALFLTEDGAPVYRCRAETDDVFGAQERLDAALHHSARVMAQYWGRLSGI